MSIVVSFRLNAAEKERLDEMCRKTGQLMGDEIRFMLRERGVSKLIDAAYRQGRREGMEKWFGKAYAPCCVCGKSLLQDFIHDARHRQIMLKAFEKWGHTTCLDERDRRRRAK